MTPQTSTCQFYATSIRLTARVRFGTRSLMLWAWPPIAVLLTRCFLWSNCSHTVVHHKILLQAWRSQWVPPACWAAWLPVPIRPPRAGVCWKKKPFILQFFLLRTVSEMLLPNTCNCSLIHQKEITAFGEVSLQNRLLSIPLLSLLLIPEVFVEAKGYLSCLDPQYGVYCPRLCSAEFPFSFRFIAPLMTSWSNSGTFQLRLVTRTVHSKV